MNYTAYSTEDFLADESFQAFVLGHDVATTSFWQQWLIENPGKAAEFHEAQTILRQLVGRPQPVSEALKQEELAKFRRYLQPKPVLRVSRRHRWPVILAAFSVMLLIGIGFWRYMAPTNLQYNTLAHQQRQLLLPDGSRVVLNGNSELKLSGDWAPGQAREVWLKGEAYFIVRHTAPARLKTVATAPSNVKFTVHAGPVDVAVLGTQFNVRHWAGHTNVVLRTGQIQLSRHQAGHTEQVLMKPGELVSTDAARPQAPLTKRAVKADFYSAWTSGHLDFNDTPVADVVALLRDGYGLQVTVNNPNLLQQNLTGSVPNQDLEVLLNSLGKSLDVQVRREGQHVWLD
ncbi:FecR family protein [Hymenobacter sp. BT730]|uniref:FecR family protein n=1 Tax=Hymenobacter sp. BT730 TaxID=3063332 RepID=UPI0026DF919D|nr:FecR domain-containing protein [Hymenobacter sp. BT730]